MINAEQNQVLTFLRSSPNTWFSVMEISRRAGTRKQFEEEPRWAVNCVRYLMDMKLVERDARGHYRIMPPKVEPAFRQGLAVAA